MFVASLSGEAATVEETLVLLLIIAATVAVIARRVGVPYTVGLVVVGLVLGLVTRVDAVSLSSDLVFYVFLPILLFEAGFNLEVGHLLTDWRRIAALAIPGVLVAFAITGAGVYWLGGTTWTVALLFAALIAATDPVSVVSLFRRLGVADRLTTHDRRRKPVQRRHGRRRVRDRPRGGRERRQHHGGGGSRPVLSG